MAGEYKGLYITFDGDSTKLTAALSEINSASRRSQSALRGVQSALRIDPKSTKLLGAAMDAARDKVDAARARVEVLRQAQDRLAASGDTTSDAYKRISRSLAQAEAHLRRDTLALIDATNAASGFGRAAACLRDVSDAAREVGARMQDAGGRLTTGVTVPLVALAAATVSSAVTIDTALTDVRKTTELTEDQYRRLKESAIELSRTQPVDAATILSLEGLGAQLGWSSDKLQDFAKTVSGLDIATDMGAEQAATNLAQFANVTGMSQDKAESYASAIVGLGNTMATTESKISDMAMGIASAGTQAGMSQADILGVAAAIASLGLEAQAGGSAFSHTITEIGTQVSTNGDQLRAWADLAHMSVDDFKSAWQTDVTGTFESVIQGMADASASGEDLNVILAELGITELRQSDLMRRLAGNADVLSTAVSTANGEWGRSSALQAEVDNRNESLAARMQVLRNRVAAVAEQLGGPLAEAAISAVDAAQPITGAIEDAAKAFSSMSAAEQRATIQTLAIAAAAGPLLTIAGKAVSGIGAVAGGLSTVVGAAVRLKAAVEVTGSLGGALDILGIKGPVAAGGIGLAVAAVAALGYAAYDAWRTERDFGDALDGMRDSADDAAAALESGTRSVTAWDGGAKDSAMSTKDLTRALQEHGDAMAGIKERASGSVEMLGQYQTVIDRLAGTGAATAEDAAMLDWALKGLNETLGTSYTTEQVLTGEYRNQAGEIVNLKGEIDGLIQKKQDEARVNATQELYTEALRNQLEMQRNLLAAESERADKVREYTRSFVDQGYSQSEAARMAEHQANANQELARKIGDATDAYDASTEEVQEWAEQMGIAQVTCTDAGRAMIDLLSSAGGWSSALSDVSLSVEQLAGAAASAGMSTETLSAIGAAGFARLAASADGDISTLTQSLTLLNQLGLDPKTFTVSDDGTILLENGLVLDLDARTIDGKRFAVSDDGTISIAQLGIAGLSARKIGDKSFAIRVNDYASATISSVLAKANSFAGKVFTATLKTLTVGGVGRADGGIVLHAGGGVRAHAGGAVFTAPTFVTSRDVIGEDGAEWYDGTHIVPLTSRHAQPLADLIAKGVAGMIGDVGAGVTYNTYVDGATVNSVPAIQDAVVALLVELARRGEMNRG